VYRGKAPIFFGDGTCSVSCLLSMLSTALQSQRSKRESMLYLTKTDYYSHVILLFKYIYIYIWVCVHVYIYIYITINLTSIFVTFFIFLIFLRNSFYIEA